MWWLVSVAAAFDSPNSTVGASGGYPWLVGGRAEAWFADELSFELGAGALGEADPLGVDLTFRWRPDVLCFACGGRALVTLGIGVTGLVRPDFELEDPWAWAVGPDVAATFVYWFNPAYGLMVGAHGGAGPGFVGDAFDDPSVEPWVFGTFGLAF
jgi:hypothetical protein